MKVRLETERLILRNLVSEDYEDAFEWCGDPVVNEYMIYPLYKNKEDVKTWIESQDTDNPNNYDVGFVLKETGELIGSGGLAYNRENDVWRIGYNIKTNMWGNGYVLEAIQALIEHIGKTRKISAIEGEFAEENHKSKRVMEKLGMVYNRDSEYAKLDGSIHFKSKIYRKEFN